LLRQCSTSATRRRQCPTALCTEAPRGILLLLLLSRLLLLLQPLQRCRLERLLLYQLLPAAVRRQAASCCYV
jgi:hypothetical protein